VSLLSDIAALKTRVTTVERRTTAVEAKNAAQGNSRAALDSRATNLEKEVDALKYIISPGGEPTATITYGAGTIANPNNYADGAVVAGAGIGVTILSGALDFGSNQEFRDLSFAASGDYAAANKNGANATTFRRCQFRGGGGSGAGANVVVMGMTGSCGHITFKDCNVERNLSPIAGADDQFCNIAIVPDGSSPSGSVVDSITFEGCNVGVSNGDKTGCPAFSLVCYTVPRGDVNRAYHGWSNVVITDCVFEGSDECVVDFADCPLDSDPTQRASGPVTMTGCTIKGGGQNGVTRFAYGLAIEAPHDVTITGNTFYRCYDTCCGTGSSSGSSDSINISDNLFLLDEDNGITTSESANAVLIGGSNVTFHGNTMSVSQGWFPIYMQGISDSFFTDNTIHDLRANPPEYPNMVVLENSDTVVVTGNTLHGEGPGDPVIYESTYGGATNVGNTLTPNTFINP
jgi:hypothetical protein